MENLPIFPNYVQLRKSSKISVPVWNGIRIVSVLAVFALIATLFLNPDLGLKIFWNGIIPILPALFLVAPGIWRNACPIAAINQTPRLFSFTKGLKLPDVLVEYSYVIGFSLFFTIASSRKWLFNENGIATGILILSILLVAFSGGIVFKGKSGWCSSFCPMLPIERMYNQTPFVTVANSHCSVCVGCTKNCYDFNPKIGNLADLYDDDVYFSNYRRFFMGTFPGFILGFFLVPNPPTVSIFTMYVQLIGFMLASAGLYFVLDSFLKVSSFKITTLFGGASIFLFYWFVLPAVFQTFFTLQSGVFLIWSARALLLAVVLWWVQRSYFRESQFIGQLRPSSETKLSAGVASALQKATSDQDKVEVTFNTPDPQRFLADEGRSLLETAERNNIPVEPGCRMGVCGADPVVILEGMENLSEMGSDEQDTIERLGHGANCRMACMARVKGAVNVTFDMSLADDAAPPDGAANYDETVKNIVIVGNGIAGVTAADYARRNHPDCEINIIGRESHQLYNRMGISRLIYGQSAMKGLYLKDDAWFDEKNIKVWLNTIVSNVDHNAKEVKLATNETIEYDRLILATGSQSFVPPITGFGLEGTFVLRAADDAINIRSFAQTNQTKSAIVAGGGLLGLEAAYAMYKLGMEVTVLERGEHLLMRQLDADGARLLKSYLESLGLHILEGVECQAVEGDSRLESITLSNGKKIESDILLVAAGIRPNLQLADDLGLDKERGVVVNDTMQTSDPDIFAAGDVCQFDGKIYGLWAVAVEQAKTAAINAVGGTYSYVESAPSTTLKIVGVDLTSIGRFRGGEEGDHEIAFEDTESNRYKKLVINDNKIVGAILLGHPLVTPIVNQAIKTNLDISKFKEDLEKDNWSALG